MCERNNIAALPTEILCPPKKTSVFLGSPARFECEVKGGLAAWKVNGTLVDALPFEIRSNVTVSQRVSDRRFSLLSLSITGRAEYNMTTVQCVARDSDGNTNQSSIVFMYIQGETILCMSINNNY